MCSTDSTDRLAEEITELASHIHAATCRWLGLVAEFDRRGGWFDWGCRSCAQWVSWRCGIAPVAAREHVRVARRLAHLPLIRAAFAEGRLSYSQVRALTRVEKVEKEEELLSLARHATAAQLERLVRAYRGVVARLAPPRAAVDELSDVGSRRRWVVAVACALAGRGGRGRARRAPVRRPAARGRRFRGSAIAARWLGGGTLGGARAGLPGRVRFRGSARTPKRFRGSARA